jgi:hypothetical protein
MRIAKPLPFTKVLALGAIVQMDQIETTNIGPCGFQTFVAAFVASFVEFGILKKHITEVKESIDRSFALRVERPCSQPDNDA